MIQYLTTAQIEIWVKINSWFDQLYAAIETKTLSIVDKNIPTSRVSELRSKIDAFETMIKTLQGNRDSIKNVYDFVEFPTFKMCISGYFNIPISLEIAKIILSSYFNELENEFNLIKEKYSF